MLPPLVKFDSRRLAIILSVLLLLKTTLALAQDEDYVGYRHELYREDDNRMRVDTDTTGWNLKINDHVSVNGQFVRDAISGATPTGAPPQSQWTFPTYTQFYQQSFNQLFPSFYGTNSANYSLYQNGYFNTFQDYTNWVAQNSPDLNAAAATNAASAYSKLTNSPNFHNNKVPLTTLHDSRFAFSLAAPLTFGISTFTPQVAYSTESDYSSVGLSLNYAIQLNQKNTILEAGWSRDYDRVRDYAFAWEPKISDDYLVGITQLLTPKSYIKADFTYGEERGYLADPYRSVMALAVFPFQASADDAELIAEVRPRFRNHEIFYTSYTQFITPLNGSVEVGYRFYHDSYGIFAHTGEFAWHQKIGSKFVVTTSFRYYWQSAAGFYTVLLTDPTLPQYYSSDYRLSRMETFNLSVDFTYRICKYASIDLAYSRYIMRGLDDVTSQSAYPSANVGSLGLRFWF